MSRGQWVEGRESPRAGVRGIEGEGAREGRPSRYCRGEEWRQRAVVNPFTAKVRVLGPGRRDWTARTCLIGICETLIPLRREGMALFSLSFPPVL